MADDVANYGELPFLLIFVFFSIVFAVISVVIVLDRISYMRLLVYSVIVWAVMVLELYALFAVNVHRRASDQVCVNIERIQCIFKKQMHIGARHPLISVVQAGQ